MCANTSLPWIVGGPLSPNVPEKKLNKCYYVQKKFMATLKLRP